MSQQPSLAVELAGIKMKNPLLTASGTYGYGREHLPFFTPDCLGAVVTKGVSREPWEGNPPPRVYETASGMLNAIGLQNPGVDYFIATAIPFLQEYQTPVIVNIVGRSIPEYVAVAEILSDYPEVSGFELNISCPNVKAGGLAFGTDPEIAAAVTRKPLVVKLSPNVTDITLIAKNVADAGADALSLINTLQGMAIDIRKRRPVLGNIMGGLSGPAVKPVALRMVWQVYRAVKLPLVGIGGIISAADAIEFIMAGATAVAIGTGLFYDPTAPKKILAGIQEFLVEEGFSNLTSIQGIAHSTTEGEPSCWNRRKY